jgi:hypothetical protein
LRADEWGPRVRCTIADATVLGVERILRQRRSAINELLRAPRATCTQTSSRCVGDLVEQRMDRLKTFGEELMDAVLDRPSADRTAAQT